MPDFRDRIRNRIAQNRREFEGQYANEIEALMGLSRAEIDAITPDGTDIKIYNDLIEVVKEASATNESQANLKAAIMELGEIAVEIARKVPGLPI